MAKHLTLSLDTASIGTAIKELQQMRDSLDSKRKIFTERLAEIGVYEASVRFATAMYDGNGAVDVQLDESSEGYKIVAAGQAVAFIEFGAGVYHNPVEPYPLPRPNGIVPIGEYGAGMGKRRGWVFTDETGEERFTRGNPAAMPMWYASEEMRKQIETIAREVFG